MNHVWQCDIVRCRAECWKYSSSDWSIFSCLDSIRARTTEHLADWQWIDAGPCDTPAKILQKAPYCHAGWYFRAAAAYLLDQHKVQWSDITFVFNSTAHLKSDAFAAAITQVQQA